MDIVSGGVIKIGEGDGGNTHVAGFGRFHGFADDLGSVGEGDEVEIFAEGANQDWLPEALNGIVGLGMAVAPIQKGLASIGLCGEGEGGDGAGDGEFVVYVEKRKLEKRWRGVKWRGKRGGLHDAGAATGF